MDVPDRLRCDDLAHLLDSLVCGEATEAVQRQAMAHGAECPGCAARHDFEAAVDREIRAQLAKIAAPRHLKLGVEAVIAIYACVPTPDDWRSV